MAFWNKKTDPVCPEGSVHAWEYKGRLYKTKEERDEAAAEDRKSRAITHLEYLLTMPMNEISMVQNDDSRDHFERTYVQHKRDALMMRRLTARDFAKMMIENWTFIKKEVETYEQNLKKDEEEEEK